MWTCSQINLGKYILIIDRISKKANSMLGFLRHNLRSCSQGTKANAFYSKLRSNLEYCSSVWNPHHEDQIQKLKMVQRRAVRYTTNCFRNTSSVQSMLQHLQWSQSRSGQPRYRLLYSTRWKKKCLDDAVCLYSMAVLSKRDFALLWIIILDSQLIKTLKSDVYTRICTQLTFDLNLGHFQTWHPPLSFL